MSRLLLSWEFCWVKWKWVVFWFWIILNCWWNCVMVKLCLWKLWWLVCWLWCWWCLRCCLVIGWWIMLWLWFRLRRIIVRLCCFLLVLIGVVGVNDLMWRFWVWVSLWIMFVEICCWWSWIFCGVLCSLIKWRCKIVFFRRNIVLVVILCLWCLIVWGYLLVNLVIKKVDWSCFWRYWKFFECLVWFV